MWYTNPPIYSSYSRGESMDLDAPFAAMNPKMQQHTAFALHRTEFALPPLITLLEQHSEPSSPAEKARTHTSFMDLPREVRLQIYGWVHRMTPFKQKQLASWYPVPKSGLFINRRVVVPPETNDDDNDDPREGEEDVSMPDAVQAPEEPKDETTKTEQKEAAEEEDTTLLCPHRPAAYLPSALLLASRDIYHEASTLPFETNEFAFINWFSSGLSGAKAFIGRLAPWQRAAIRNVRIEVPVADLELNSVVGFCGVWNKRGLQQWLELCAMLSGLRGFRLKICEKVAGFGTGAREMKPSEPTKDGWVAALARMERLRSVEVELNIEGWGERKKVEWCAKVEELVNSVREEEGMMGQVEVVCVETVQK